MMKGTLVAGLALLTALLPHPAAASAIATPALIPAGSDLVHPAQLFCGWHGCGPIWPGPRDERWGWTRWEHVYRPACPTDYYYACRRGPLGYGQCACWPYRRW